MCYFCFYCFLIIVFWLGCPFFLKKRGNTFYNLPKLKFSAQTNKNLNLISCTRYVFFVYSSANLLMIVGPFVSKLLSFSLMFFQIGLFTVGGGLVALTLMHQRFVPEYIEEEAFYSFVAVSESTPGAIGVNMSTYIGYEELGIIGSLCITLAFILPSFLSILMIAKESEKFKNSIGVQRCFYGLKAASTALVGIAVYRVLISSVFTLELFKEFQSYDYIVGYKELIFFTVLLTLSFTAFKKMHPVFFIAVAVFFGFFFL